MKTRLGKRDWKRKGYTYIVVMGVALIVSTLGLSTMLLVRIRTNETVRANSASQATYLAHSAIEHALTAINSDSNWRTTYASGLVNRPLGEGMFSWILEDVDGNLAEPDTDLRLSGIGRVGQASRVYSVKLEGLPQLLDSLQSSVYSVGAMSQSSTSSTNGGPFATAGTLTIDGAINGDVEGNPVVNPDNATGTVTDPGPTRNMPSPSVWNTYFALATEIPYASLSSGGIERSVLSAAENPYGTTNSEGVYYIHVPAGSEFWIMRARVAATLLIELKPNADFRLYNTNLMEPSIGKNYPAMIVKANGIGSTVNLSSSNSLLKESSPPPMVNLNPPSTPYQGQSDTDEVDQCTGELRGLYHIIGASTNTILGSNQNVNGVVVTEGTVTLGANLDVTTDPNLFSDPPVGYTGPSGTPLPVTGSWRWEPAP